MIKVIKKLTVIFLSVFAMACGCAGLSACSAKGGALGGSGGNFEGEAGKWNEYDGVKVGFVDETAYNAGEIDESKVFSELDCKIGKTYYMFVDFDIQAPYDNDGRETVTADVKIQPAVAISAKIQDTNTGTTDVATKDDITEIKAAYKIPETAETVRNMRLVIQLNALRGSEVYLDISFKNDGGILAVKTEEISKTLTVEFTQELKYSSASIVGYTDKLSGELNEIVVPVMANREYVNLTGIGDSAFSNCSNLTGITIPDCVTYIGKGAFNNCKSLAKITIGENNTAYAALDGILYNKEKTEFIHIPSALSGAVTIPEGIDSIGEGAFKYRSGLTALTIPSSVKSFGKHALSYCEKLMDITYNGTQAQWGTITKSLWWNYDTGRYTVHCTNGDIKK